MNNLKHLLLPHGALTVGGWEAAGQQAGKGTSLCLPSLRLLQTPLQPRARLFVPDGEDSALEMGGSKATA